MHPLDSVSRRKRHGPVKQGRPRRGKERKIKVLRRQRRWWKKEKKKWKFQRPQGIGPGGYPIKQEFDENGVEVDKRKPPYYVVGLRAKQQVRMYQASTALLISPIQFHLLVRRIVRRISLTMRFQPQALVALQEAAESYLVGLFQDAQAAAHLRCKKTLEVRDMMLVLKLKNELRRGHFPQAGPSCNRRPLPKKDPMQAQEEETITEVKQELEDLANTPADRQRREDIRDALFEESQAEAEAKRLQRLAVLEGVDTPSMQRPTFARRMGEIKRRRVPVVDLEDEEEKEKEKKEKPKYVRLYRPETHTDPDDTFSQVPAIARNKRLQERMLHGQVANWMGQCQTSTYLMPRHLPNGQVSYRRVNPIYAQGTMEDDEGHLIPHSMPPCAGVWRPHKDEMKEELPDEDRREWSSVPSCPVKVEPGIGSASSSAASAKGQAAASSSRAAPAQELHAGLDPDIRVKEEGVRQTRKRQLFPVVEQLVPCSGPLTEPVRVTRLRQKVRESRLQRAAVAAEDAEAAFWDKLDMEVPAKPPATKVTVSSAEEEAPTGIIDVETGEVIEIAAPAVAAAPSAPATPAASVQGTAVRPASLPAGQSADALLWVDDSDDDPHNGLSTPKKELEDSGERMEISSSSEEEMEEQTEADIKALEELDRFRLKVLSDKLFDSIGPKPRPKREY